MISQKQQISIHQKLSPQQIMLMKLIQVPAISLEQTIKDEIERNPMLEEEENSKEQTDINDLAKNELGSNEKLDVNDYSDEESIPNYKLASNNYSHGDEQREVTFSTGKTFHEFLLEQLDLQDLSEKGKLIGIELIGNIDEAGYLDRDLDAMVNDFLFRQNLQTTASEIKHVLNIIQTFDPPGVGARNLQECLLIQLKRSGNQTEAVKNAILILENHFESFVKKHYNKIIKKLRLSDQELKDALDEIVKLNPKPGNSVFDSEKVGQYIVPDFVVYLNGNNVEFTLNDRYVPYLKVNKYYSDMLQSMITNKGKTEKDRKTINFIKEKIDSAKWFIDAVKQRQDTLKITMQAIIDYQKNYFINGDISKLKPMRLKEIADMTNLDISTISRVVNQKYAQTHFGTFLLKDFFSKSYTNDEGEDVATEAIKQILVECIETENKQNPLTDEELKEILNQKGFPLARRTVAKYRESLKIPVGRLRIEIKDREISNQNHFAN